AQFSHHPVDPVQHLPGLQFDAGTQVVGNLSGEEYDVADTHGLAHPLTGMQVSKGHLLSFQSLSAVPAPASARERSEGGTVVRIARSPSAVRVACAQS